MPGPGKENGAGGAGEMGCPGCGHRNPAGSRSCNACGQALIAAGQPDPHTELPPELARKIRAARGSLEGERKQVTVLFADVVESMELAERLGAEEWRALMGRVLSLLCAGVYRFEGTVQDFTGDGIMALFGAPIAHEDHPQRACHAALRIRAELPRLAAELREERGLELSLRIGVNSGEVVVGAIGEDLRLDYAAIGHAVGLAQRMESLAEPGSVYLSEPTAALVSGYFELSELGRFQVKGAARPLRVFRLEAPGAARDKLERSRTWGLTRFVGRLDELRVLERDLERALAGEAQVVGVVAEAGVGKSRLGYEFASRCRERGISVYEAHASAHGKALPFLPVLELLRAYFGISERDPAQAAREKVEARLLSLDPGFAADLPLILDLLGLADPSRPVPVMDPEARQRRLLAAMGRLVETNSRREPSVSVVEDLHWLDPESQLFLDNLVASVPGTRSLVLLTFRPEYRPGWDGELPYRELRLLPLEHAALAELLRELLGEDPSLDGLAELVAEHTRGNPFFVEEAVRELEESGALEGERGSYRLVRQIEELAVPPSVQAILAARIDRLEPEAKAALGAAAAIGGEFRGDLLARVLDLDGGALDTALRQLVASEFVHQTAPFPESEFEFRHPLIREVAYGSQLAAARARAHAAIARALQELEPQRLDELAALIAQHFEAAGEPLDAARWHARAGWGWLKEPAVGHRHWQRVRELDPELAAGPEVDTLRVHSRMMIVANAHRFGADLEEIRELFEEGREIAERIGDRAGLAVLHGGLGHAIRSCGGDVSEAARLSDEAVRIAEGGDDPDLRVACLSMVSYHSWLAGRHEGSLAAADRILELTAEDPHLGAALRVTGHPRAWAMWVRVLPLMTLGRLEEARRALAEGAELCRRWDRSQLGVTHAIYGLMATWGADPFEAETLAHAHQAVEIAEELGEVFSRVASSASLGAAQTHAGELEEAEHSFQRCLALIAERRAGGDLEPLVHRLRAEALAAGGELERAIEAAELALRLTDERGVRAFAPGVRHSLARIRIARGGSPYEERAAALLDEAEGIAREMGARTDLAAILRARVLLCELRGDREGRERALSEALELARRIDARGLLVELEAQASPRAWLDA